MTKDSRLIIPSVATSRPCERGWLRTDVDRDAVADHRLVWQFRWREPVALHDDAAPSEGSTGEQQRAGRRGWASFSCLLVDEQVLAGSWEGLHGRAIRADQMHPADSIERIIRSRPSRSDYGHGRRFFISDGRRPFNRRCDVTDEWPHRCVSLFRAPSTPPHQLTF